MSASNQKKLRKEKAEAYMTERQRIEAQEKKKLKIYTATFWIVMALCVSVVLVSVLSNPIKNVVYKNTKAVTIGDHTLNAVQLNYFYVDAVNAYVSEYSSYISYILDTTKPLNEQTPSGSEKTWAATFLDMAFENIKSTYALYDLAVQKGHKLTEDEQTSLNSMSSTMSLYAIYYGYSDIDDYLRAIYGNGASQESYMEYYEISAMADSYYTAYSDSLEYDDEALRAYEKDKLHEYSSYTYATYYVNATKFREGGTKGEDGTTTYTDEEKKAAIEKAEAAANALAAGEYKDLEAFNAAIKAMDINKGVESVKATEYEDVLYSKVNSLFQDFVSGKVENKDEKAAESEDKDEEKPTYEERKEGDMKVIASESGSGDSKTVNGYYVVRFQKVNDNKFALKNVRHILVKFEGGTTSSTTGETTYTDAEKNTAKVAAEALLKQWKEGAATEDSFAELATKETDDSGSQANGGLYEEVYPGQMVENFEDWCYDAERKTGDTGIVESTYGYHIMYFVGDADVNYRDYMITNNIRSEDLEEWHDGLVEAIKLTELNLSLVDMDMILGS